MYVVCDLCSYNYTGSILDAVSSFVFQFEKKNVNEYLYQGHYKQHVFAFVMHMSVTPFHSVRSGSNDEVSLTSLAFVQRIPDYLSPEQLQPVRTSQIIFRTNPQKSGRHV